VVCVKTARNYQKIEKGTKKIIKGGGNAKKE
jgi:hypothetical protein